MDRLGRLGPDHPPLGPEDRQAGAHPAGPSGLRPRPGVPPRRQAARLLQRGPQPAALGRGQRARRWPPSTATWGSSTAWPSAPTAPGPPRAAWTAPIKLWPAAAPDPQVIFRNGSGWVGTVAFHPDGTPGRHGAQRRHPGLGSADRRGALAGHRPPRPAGPDRAWPSAATARCLLASGPGGAINLWDAETGKLRPRAGPHRRRRSSTSRSALTARCWRPPARTARSGSGTSSHGAAPAAHPDRPCRGGQRRGVQPRRPAGWPPPARTRTSRSGTSRRERAGAP